eukprot:483818-Rhodomonas_salina.1
MSRTSHNKPRRLWAKGKATIYDGTSCDVTDLRSHHPQYLNMEPRPGYLARYPLPVHLPRKPKVKDRDSDASEGLNALEEPEGTGLRSPHLAHSKLAGTIMMGAPACSVPSDVPVRLQVLRLRA